MDNYRYKISSTGGNSQKYGNCEICGEHATEVFSQSEERQFTFEGKEHWTNHKCNSYFGHEECLISKRR